MLAKVAAALISAVMLTAGASSAFAEMQISQRLTPDNNGETIEVSIGSVIAVELPASLANLEKWERMAAPGFLSPFGTKTDSSNNAEFQMDRVWTAYLFHVDGGGSGALHFQKHVIRNSGFIPIEGPDADWSVTIIAR